MPLILVISMYLLIIKRMVLSQPISIFVIQSEIAVEVILTIPITLIESD